MWPPQSTLWAFSPQLLGITFTQAPIRIWTRPPAAMLAHNSTASCALSPTIPWWPLQSSMVPLLPFCPHSPPGEPVQEAGALPGPPSQALSSQKESFALHRGQVLCTSTQLVKQVLQIDLPHLEQRCSGLPLQNGKEQQDRSSPEA